MTTNDAIRLLNYKEADFKYLADEALLRGNPIMYFMNSHTQELTALAPGKIEQAINNEDGLWHEIERMTLLDPDIPSDMRSKGKYQRIKKDGLFVSKSTAGEVLRTRDKQESVNTSEEIDPRSEKTYLQVIAALLDTFDSATTKSGLTFKNQAELKSHMLTKFLYPSGRSLDSVFSDANKVLPTIQRK